MTAPRLTSNPARLPCTMTATQRQACARDTSSIANEVHSAVPVNTSIVTTRHQKRARCSSRHNSVSTDSSGTRSTISTARTARAAHRAPAGSPDEPRTSFEAADRAEQEHRQDEHDAEQAEHEDARLRHGAQEEVEAANLRVRVPESRRGRKQSGEHDRQAGHGHPEAGACFAFAKVDEHALEGSA